MSQQGRPDDGTDATGFFNGEFFAPLRPNEDWRRGSTRRKLTAKLLGQALEDPVPRRGVQFLAVHPGQRRGGGVRRQGRELDQAVRQRSRCADQDGQQDQGRDGHRAGHHRSRGVHLARAADDPHRRRSRPAARYGLSPGDINAAVQTAIGGQSAGDVYEDGSDRHFPIMVRLAAEYRGRRRTPIRNLRIAVQPATTNGIVQIPLAELADVSIWFPGPRSSIASSSSATSRSSSACADAISAARSLRRSAGSPRR